MSKRSSSAHWTYEDYARLPDDGNRYEVIDGEVLVTPAPTTFHQHVLFTLAIALRQYAERHGLGVVLPGVDVLFVSGQFLRPDIVFVPEPVRDGIKLRGIEKAPGLVVEILSPGSASIDRVKKPRRYGDFGVPEYWVVDPDERTVWVWRFVSSHEPERAIDRITWQPNPHVEAFVMDLEQLFRPI
jgi:Uma2 family endonuclease